MRKILFLSFIFGIITLTITSVLDLQYNNLQRQIKISENVSSTPSPTPVQHETVMVTIHGFVPEVLTVRKGTYINFANFSDKEIDIEFDKEKGKSDAEMTVGKIDINGTSNPKKFSKLGTYHYRNAQNQEQTGKIIIQ